MKLPCDLRSGARERTAAKEVLLTQRDALGSRFELVETRLQQMNAVVNVYQSLGGGWR